MSPNFGQQDSEGHRSEGETEISPLRKVPAMDQTEIFHLLQNRAGNVSVALDGRMHSTLFSIPPDGMADHADGPIGYCWPGHSEIQSEWLANQVTAFLNLTYSESKFIPSTFNQVELHMWDGHGMAWHNLSALGQLNKKAVAAYGAIASCLGTTKWWISYRHSGDWKWALNGWKCGPGGWGFWKVPTEINQVKFLGIPVYGKYEYERFDMKFHAESEPGAFHRYFVGFVWAADN